MVLVGLAILQLQSNHGKKTVMFYGFAETKETEINLDHPIEVNKIMVTSGQRVFEGDLLVEVTQADFGFKQNNINHQMEGLKAEAVMWESNIRSEIAKLSAQRTAMQGEISSQIRQLEVEQKVNKALLEDLETIYVPNQKTLDPISVKINSLKKELELSVRPLTLQINKLKQSLRNGNSPSKVQMEKLKDEMDYYDEEASKLSIEAPLDGIIGNVFCKEKENIDAFATLITFYEKNPTMVKGFVHENLILEVEVGDTLEAISHQHEEHRCKGVITGMGSRIVEIPERLRKNPTFKTYGREVLIEIPPTNYFLQSEKVMLNLVKESKDSRFLGMFADRF